MLLGVLPPAALRRLPAVLILLAGLGAPGDVALPPVPATEKTADDAAGAAAPRLVAPTLGRPVFVRPGRTFRAVALFPADSGQISAALVREGVPGQRFPLDCEPDAAAKLRAGKPVRLMVPDTVPPRTYDLELRCDDVTLLARHCVAVTDVNRVLRVVHLSNMNVGDLGAPHFDQRLIDEINLLAPTVILATGDYLDAAHPDPQTGWEELVRFVTRFDAPVIMACGDHDDVELYSRYVAPSPIDLLEVGANRCLVLLDHRLAPIQKDAEQVRWVERVLLEAAFDGVTLVVTHDDRPNLLHHWWQQGTLQKLVRAGRLGLWFAGGHSDWDGQAFADVLAAARPMAYFRTHQSSPAPREGASGVSHYRVVDVVHDRIVACGESESGTAPPSLAVGYLQAACDGPNDGTRARLSLSAVNNHPQRLERLAYTLRLKKTGDERPWCHGAWLEQALDLGDAWECRLRFDLPEKGNLRAVAGVGAAAPFPVVGVRFETWDTLQFRRQSAPSGLTFYSQVNEPPVVHLRNQGDALLTVSPLARLDGDPVAYRPLEADGQFATAYRLQLAPGEMVSLQLDLSAVRVTPGRRELQVYLDLGDALVPYCHTVTVVVADQPPDPAVPRWAK